MNIETSGLTDRGNVRKKNDDHFLLARLSKALCVESTSLPSPQADALTNEISGRVLLVADGMGGVEGGREASAIAVRQLTEYMVEQMPWFLERSRLADRDEVVSRDPFDEEIDSRDGVEFRDQMGSRQDVELQGELWNEKDLGGRAAVRAELQRALVSCHHEIVEASRRGVGAPGMGSTLTMALILWPDLLVAHAGDSRCYVVRDGRAEQLTTDHTMADRMVRQGLMSQEEAKTSRMSHVLTQCVGGSSHNIDPQVIHTTLRDGDVVVLSSDGLTGEIDDRELAMIVDHTDDAELLCQSLTLAAKAAGGRDNITVAVARCTTEDVISDVDLDQPRGEVVSARSIFHEPVAVPALATSKSTRSEATPGDASLQDQSEDRSWDEITLAVPISA